MKNKGFSVSAHLDVEFDRETAGDRRLRRSKRVFDHAPGLIVETAMGDRTLDEPGGSVDRRQALTSKTASISASALSGRCETPTVPRAWRPLAPNNSATRSEAPFIAWGRASKDDATLKNPPSRTTCSTRSRSPSAA